MQPLLDRITELGGDPVAAMDPFHKAFDVFHAATAPSDWLEGLMKAYVGDGLAADFYREIAAFIDADTRQLVLSSLQDAGQADFVVERVCQSVALPGLCPGGGGGGDNPLPLPTSLPDLGLGLNRPAALEGGDVSMDRMMDTWNPILVALLMPGVAQ